MLATFLRPSNSDSLASLERNCRLRYFPISSHDPMAPNRLEVSRSYVTNFSGRLNTIQTGPGGSNSIQSDSYGYDSQGNLTSRSNRMGGNANISETFIY